MAAYHVFVDGPGDPSPAGQENLAAAIATHYGMPIDAVRARIASGRFRVKGDCDRTTADTYVRDLTALGARCSVEEASSANVAKTPLPFPAQPRQTTPPAIARTTSNKNYQSGLSAAFSGEQPVASLGALEDPAAFKLSSVDGNDHEPAPEKPAASFAPPPETAPAPAKTKKAEPIDMFAPPDAAEEAAFSVDLAPDEVERSAKKRTSVPPENVEPPPARASRPSLQAPTVPLAPVPTGIHEPRTRFIVGVVLAIAIGFIPATLVASAREKSAYKTIDAKVVELQNQAVTPEDYAALDGMRMKQLERKQDDRRNAALLAFIIWGAVGAGVAFAWFKKLVPPE